MEKLTCVVQDYAWGDVDAIPSLLGIEPTGEPQAEMWMGAHPKAPSTVARTGVSLDTAVAADPHGLLGDVVAAHWGRLPFLFKVLAAGKPLSIQAHPSLDQAAAGFVRENDAGVDLGSPIRTYRDDNHKPEMICALTPFVGKCGFRNRRATIELFDLLDTPALDELRSRLAADGSDKDVLAELLAWLLRMPNDDAATLVAATVAAAAEATPSTATEPQTTDLGGFAAELSWCARINAAFPNDVGVVVALLLNHVVLEPGQAFFLGAGNLHAYIGGVGVELMANSDNVVRGGLTPKNIDVEELLTVVDCTPIDPPVQTPAGPVHRFDAPVPEFGLTRIELQEEPVDLTVDGPEIVIVTSGSATVAGSSTEQLSQGEVLFIGASENNYSIAGPAGGIAFRAAVGTTVE